MREIALRVAAEGVEPVMDELLLIAPYGVFEAAWEDAGQVPHIAVLPDASRVDIPPPQKTQELAPVPEPAPPEPLPSGGAPLRRAPLGVKSGARVARPPIVRSPAL